MQAGGRVMNSGKQLRNAKRFSVLSLPKAMGFRCNKNGRIREGYGRFIYSVGAAGFEPTIT
jgi:hypothetical protein